MSSTVRCPYFPTHLFPEKTWPYHVPLCRLKYEAQQIGEPMRVCPFSARHIVHASRYYDHIASCEVRAAQLAEKSIQLRAITGKVDAPEPTQIFSIAWEDVDGSESRTEEPSVARPHNVSAAEDTLSIGASASDSGRSLSEPPGLEPLEDDLSFGRDAREWGIDANNNNDDNNDNNDNNNNDNNNNNNNTRSCAKALVEFVVSADGKMCGARLVYAAGPEQESIVAYEPIESDAFRKWLMGKMRAFTTKVTGAEIFRGIDEEEEAGSRAMEGPEDAVDPKLKIAEVEGAIKLLD